MALTYNAIHNQLSTLLNTLKAASSKGVVLNKEGKNRQIIHCEDILKKLESYQNQTLFDLVKFISETLMVHVPSTKTNKIQNTFYAKLEALYQQLIICDEVSDIIKKKRIESFDPEKDIVHLSDDISVHSKLLFKKVYSKPHILDVDEATEISRDLHGIQHVNRVAYYIPILVNLYRRYGDTEAEALTSEDVKLLQIAALFHDTGRERGDGIDYWDQDSALLAFDYFRNTLKVPDAKAKLLAEAIANKDMKEGRYYQLVTNLNGTLSWKLIAQNKRNIYQKVLHDSDSIDILRARPTNDYNAEYLDFYQEIAKKNPQAKAEMAELIYEVRSLIERQGDGFLRQKNNVKKYYEHAKGYLRTVTQVAASENYHLLRALYTPDIETVSLKRLRRMRLLKKPLKYDHERELDEANMNAALEKGIVFARGIADPSATVNKQNKKMETQAELEIRKTLRREGKPTRTNKAERLMKHGNPNRSVALVGFGAVPFAAAGFLIVDNDLKHEKIKSISKANIVSGFGKKKNIIGLVSASDDEKEAALQNLIATLQIGGGNNTSAHSEIIYHTDHFDAIYFTQDAVFANKQTTGGSATKTSEPFHKHAPLLQAIYLQKQYEMQSGIKLSLFEYSGIHRFAKKQVDLNNSDIAALFVTMCKDYISAQVASASPELFQMTVEEIKIYSMYGNLHAIVGHDKKNLQAADTYLPDEIRESINKEIAAEIQKAQHTVLQKIRCKSLPLFSPMALAVLKSMKPIPKDLRALIVKEIDLQETREDFFKKQLTGLFDLIQGKNTTRSLHYESYDVFDDVFNIFSYLENYSKLIGKSEDLDKFKQMIHDLLNSYLRNNIDNITELYPGKKLSLWVRVRKIVDFLSPHEADSDLFVDLVIRLTRNFSEFEMLKVDVFLDHPKLLAHIHQLLAKLPYTAIPLNIDTYLRDAKRYGFPEQKMHQGVSVFIDNMVKAKQIINGFDLCSILDCVSFQEKSLNKKMLALFDCTRVDSLYELIDILNILASKHSYIDKHQLSHILTQLSQKLLDKWLNTPDFHLFPLYDSHEKFIAAVGKLTSLPLSDTYKRNMLTLIKMVPDNTEGLYFVQRIRLLNSQLGFNVDLQVSTNASAAATPDKENIPNASGINSRHSFFASKVTQSKKQPNEAIAPNFSTEKSTGAK